MSSIIPLPVAYMCATCLMLMQASAGFASGSSSRTSSPAAPSIAGASVVVVIVGEGKSGLDGPLAHAVATRKMMAALIGQRPRKGPSYIRRARHSKGFGTIPPPHSSEGKIAP